METKNTKVLEALKMQPLSEEEKASRHILGRLYGPIATTKEKTRNGRGYNKELWEKALADDIFKEKIANKSLFLELGHPLDREETDMTCICACIPALPKIVDGDLYAYVDILDTPNGRLLKTLCDYGFVPGISSRGSGDIMANDEVDPETFFLETWDIVQLPAVKKARLAMCESLNCKSLTTVLNESYAKASDEDKKVMKEALEQLDIKLTEEDLSDIPFAPDPEEDTNILTEADEVEEVEDIEAVEEPVKETEVEEAEEIEAEETVEIETDETEEEPVEVEDEIEEDEDVEDDGYTVKALIKSLEDYDDKLDIEFKPIIIDEKEYEVTALEFDDSEDGKVVVNINYSLPEVEETEEDDNILPEDENPVVEIEEVSSEEEPQPEEAAESSEEAVDDGDEEVIESLKEMVRQKDLLENEVRYLKNQKTVSDAEVDRLNEELNKYKSGFMRVSELASKSTKLEKEVVSLSEQLKTKDTTITNLQSKIEHSTRLTESVKANESKVKDLTEKLITAQNEAEETEKDLRKQLEESRAKVQERTKLAKAYKANYTAVLERYIASKANMLGVRPTDITSRLNENYSLDDIDQVCEDLLDMSRPTFGFTRTTTKAAIKESTNGKTVKKPFNPDDGYEIDDDLLVLAGLK